MVKKSDLNEDPPGLGEKVYTRHLWAWWIKNLFIIARKLSLVHTQMQDQENTCVNNINTFKCKCKRKCEHTVMACILHLHLLCEPRQCKCTDKKTGSTGFMTPWPSEVESKIACSILDEQLTKSVYENIRCFMINIVQIKLKKILAWKDVAKKNNTKKPRFTIENINSKYTQI